MEQTLLISLGTLSFLSLCWALSLSLIIRIGTKSYLFSWWDRLNYGNFPLYLGVQPYQEAVDVFEEGNARRISSAGDDGKEKEESRQIGLEKRLFTDALFLLSVLECPNGEMLGWRWWEEVNSTSFQDLY